MGTCGRGPFSEELEAAYAYLYTLAARGFVDTPDEEFVSAVRSDLTLDAALLLGEFGHRGSRVADSLESMRANISCCTPSAYADLFMGPGGVKVVIWESAVRTATRSLFQKGTLDVRECYAREGFVVQGYPRVSDDQLGTELSFMAALCTKALDAHNRGDVEERDRVSLSRRAFGTDHLLQWCKLVIEELQRFDKGRFWIACATMAFELLNCDCGFCNVDEAEVSKA